MIDKIQMWVTAKLSLSSKKEQEESRKAIIKPPLLYNEAKKCYCTAHDLSKYCTISKILSSWNSAVSVNDAIVNYSAPHFKCIAALSCANQLLAAAGPIFVCPPLDFQVESL